MEIVEEILLSPLGAILVIMLLALYLLFYLKPLKEKKKSEKLLNFFGGSFSFPLGTIKIPFQNRSFCISFIARGGGAYGSGGGSYPVLWSYVNSSKKIIIGHELSKDYTRGPFLILPAFSILEVGKNRVLVGSDDPKIKNKVEKLLLESPELSTLFDKVFSHLTIASEWHVGRHFIEKKYVFRYTCLDMIIFEKPELLQHQLELIGGLLDQLEL